MTRHYAIGGTSARESLLPAGSFERRARFSGSPLVRSRVVREASARYGTYEPESSERRALGSVSISADAHWTATLTVPMAGGVAFVDLERRGALPRGYRGGEERAQLLRRRRVTDQRIQRRVTASDSSGPDRDVAIAPPWDLVWPHTQTF